jgi:hypothetical protein
MGLAHGPGGIAARRTANKKAPTYLGDGAMMDKTYKELAELAVICADEARASTSRDVAEELWRMARGYQRRASVLEEGHSPDIGDPPAPGGLSAYLIVQQLF